jgi:hypothetical protein
MERDMTLCKYCNTFVPAVSMNKEKKRCSGCVVRANARVANPKRQANHRNFTELNPTLHEKRNRRDLLEDAKRIEEEYTL